MKENYEVSIVIPVYNVEKFVKTSLLSALNQDFKSIQYVIVDDCSQDKSMQMVKDVIAHSERRDDIKIVTHEKNSGLSAARNTGIDNSVGKYIYFMDSDDEIIPNCISLHYNKIVSSHADFTVAATKLVGAKSIHIHPIPDNVENFPPLTTYYRRDWSVSATNKLYSREFIDANKLRFIVGMIHEDYLWSYEASKRASKIAVVNVQTYIYKIHPGSITTIRYNDAKIDSMLKVITTINEGIEEGNLEGRKFLDFIKLNTALYILNYHGRESRYAKYRKVQSVRCKVSHTDLASTLLKLPYPLFYMLIKPLYLIYKSIK